MNFPCAVCSKLFKTKKHLLDHERGVHAISRNVKTMLENDDIYQYIYNCRRSIKSYIKDGKYKLTDSTLSIFKCLSVLDSHDQLFEKFKTFSGKSTFTMNDLSLVEACFDVSLTVYKPNLGKTARIFLTPVWTSQRINATHGKFQLLIYELNGETWFNLINSLQTLLRLWICERCKYQFDRRSNFTRHEKYCKGPGMKFKYPGGGWYAGKTVFDDLASYGLQIPTELRFNKFRCFYDWEACTIPMQKQVGTKTQHVAYLQPLSVSIVANISGYENPKVFIADSLTDADIAKLVAQSYDYQLEISEAARATLAPLYKPYFEVLDQWEARTDDTEKWENWRRKIQRMRKWLTAFQDQLVCIGFCSSKFDLKLVYNTLILHMLKRHNPKDVQVLRKGTSIIALVSPNIRFVDQCLYHGPGLSYQGFLDMHQIKQSKLPSIPFEYLDSIEKLEEGMPPKSAWDSSLKNVKMADEEYAAMQQFWNDNGITTIREHIQIYNAADVYGGLLGSERYFEIFKTLQVANNPVGMDCYKSAFTLPGLASALMFKSLPKHLWIQLESSKVWNAIFEENCFGGINLIFKRHVKRGVTFLDSSETTKTNVIIGYDIVGSYCHAITRVPLPVSLPVDWQWNGTKFTPKYVIHANSSIGELQWVSWLSFYHNIEIRHRYHIGQFSLEQFGYPKMTLDGLYIDESTGKRTALAYHGCRYHAHGCYLDPEWDVLQQHRRVEHEQKMTILHTNFDRVVEIYECDFIREKKTNPNLRQFLADNFLPERQTPKTHDQLLQAVLDGRWTGVLLVDVELTDPIWKKKIEEFQVIFKRAIIGREHLSDSMRQYCDVNNTLEKPTSYLIGSFFAIRQCFTARYLRWLMLHGHTVTKIHLARQYKEQPCLKTLGDTIELNRQSDDPAVNSTWKVCGNSLFGRTLMKKRLHKDIKFTITPAQLCRLARNPFFHKSEILDSEESVLQCEMRKKLVTIDQPKVIGFYTFMHSKLRLVAFHYDFIRRFIPSTADVSLVYSDTDSLYYHLREPATCFEDLISSDDEEAWELEKKNWLADETDKVSCKTLGLFKVEAVGVEMAIPSCKCYQLVDEAGQTKKLSQKGVSKKLNSYTLEEFLQPIYQNQPGTGINKGFLLVNEPKEMVRVDSTRAAISGFYVKRPVAEDKISTQSICL